MQRSWATCNSCQYTCMSSIGLRFIPYFFEEPVWKLIHILSPLCWSIIPNKVSFGWHCKLSKRTQAWAGKTLRAGLTGNKMKFLEVHILPLGEKCNEFGVILWKSKQLLVHPFNNYWVCHLLNRYYDRSCRCAKKTPSSRDGWVHLICIVWIVPNLQRINLRCFDFLTYNGVKVICF